MPDQRSSLIEVVVINDNEGYLKTIVDVINFTDGMTCVGAFTTCEDAIAYFRKTGAGTRPHVIMLDIVIK